MASFTKINNKWRVLVRRKGYPVISKYFDKKVQAVAWAADIEKQIASGIAPKSKDAFGKPEQTIESLIKKYRKMRESVRPILDTSTEHYTLLMLCRMIGNLSPSSMTVDDLIGWAHARKDDGAGPYTVNCDLSKLGTVLRYAGESLPDIIGAARPKLSYLGLIGGGGKRERLPTEDEMARLEKYLRDTHGDVYADAMKFAAITAMRRGEVCEIRFADIDSEKRLVQVARKHPRKGKVVEWVPLLSKAWAIVQARPKDDERIFPVHPQTLSKYFLMGCRELGIPDLHWHDLRHKGATDLFLDGMPIEKVALVTGHKSWTNLRRYTNLKPESVHDNDLGNQRHHGSQSSETFHPRKSE